MHTKAAWPLTSGRWRTSAGPRPTPCCGSSTEWARSSHHCRPGWKGGRRDKTAPPLRGQPCNLPRPRPPHPRGHWAPCPATPRRGTGTARTADAVQSTLRLVLLLLESAGLMPTAIKSGRVATRQADGAGTSATSTGVGLWITVRAAAVVPTLAVVVVRCALTPTIAHRRPLRLPHVCGLLQGRCPGCCPGCCPAWVHCTIRRAIRACPCVQGLAAGPVSRQRVEHTRRTSAWRLLFGCSDPRGVAGYQRALHSSSRHCPSVAPMRRLPHR